MKKIISILLVLTMLFAVTACGKKKVETTEENNDNQVVETMQDEKIQEPEEKEEQKEDKKEEKPAEKPQTEKPQQVTQENKSEVKPTENKPQESKPQENKPQEIKPQENKPQESKPVENKPVEEKPVQKPQETKPTTIGTTLLAEFNNKASGMGTEELANELLKNPVIKFGGVTAPVEEGLLTGFVNNEIKGFKSGTAFAPMIGTIPFVGYIFELESGVDTASFISNLRSKAKMNWNICTEADEMVTGSVGNKVFFVMCRNSEE